MHAPFLTLALLTTSALATPGVLSNPRSFGAMLKRGEALSKRQGYYPSTDPCTGDGTTCAQVCGADTVECPSSNDAVLSCHSTSDGSHCCTDGTGNACGPGDYCTHDAAGQTYCCPQNLNAADCAKAFGVSVSLIPEASSLASSPKSSAPVPASSPAATTKTPAVSSAASSSLVPLSASSSAPSSASSRASQTPVVPVLPSSSHASAAESSKAPNATSTGPSQPEFTGAAARAAGAGAAMLLAVAGWAVL